MPVIKDQITTLRRHNAWSCLWSRRSAPRSWCLTTTGISARCGRHRCGARRGAGAQITGFGLASGGHLRNQVAEHIGGTALV